MARLLPPPGGMTPFDHRPELWAAFNRYYGTLWSEGVVDQADEGGRPAAQRAEDRLRDLQEPPLRRRPRAPGSPSTTSSHIDDDFATSTLPDRWKLTIRYADALIVDPKGIDDDLRAALLARVRLGRARRAHRDDHHRDRVLQGRGRVRRTRRRCRSSRSRPRPSRARSAAVDSPARGVDPLGRPVTWRLRRWGAKWVG